MYNTNSLTNNYFEKKKLYSICEFRPFLNIKKDNPCKHDQALIQQKQKRIIITVLYNLLTLLYSFNIHCRYSYKKFSYLPFY